MDVVTKEESGRSCFIVVGANLFLFLLAAGLRVLQFRSNDPYTNPVSDIATVFWLLALGAGIVGLIVVGKRLANRQRVPAFALVWFVLVGVYVARFFFYFTQFMLAAM